ncbi:MAG TPA: hypothetical protein VKA63_11080, partial [Candidatus Krumholzibacteria bacterium]|nr:hypothetical protein [Candidatus Krumholzibacteria bacterium]
MNFDLDATVDCLKDNSGRIHARVVGTSTRGYSKEAVSLGLYLAGVGYFSEALLYLEPAINNWGNLPDLLLQEVGECWSLTLYALGQREQLRRFVRGPATSLKSKSKALCLL